MRAGEGDFLDVILKKRSLSEEETVSIVLDIMLGGYETTATLLALIVYFLAHAPAVFQKLKVITIKLFSLFLLHRFMYNLIKRGLI